MRRERSLQHSLGGRGITVSLVFCELSQSAASRVLTKTKNRRSHEPIVLLARVVCAALPASVSIFSPSVAACCCWLCCCLLHLSMLACKKKKRRDDRSGGRSCVLRGSLQAHHTRNQASQQGRHVRQERSVLHRVEVERGRRVATGKCFCSFFRFGMYFVSCLYSAWYRRKRPLLQGGGVAPRVARARREAPPR